MRYNDLHNQIYRIIKIICQMNVGVTRVTGIWQLHVWLACDSYYLRYNKFL